MDTSKVSISGLGNHSFSFITNHDVCLPLQGHSADSPVVVSSSDSSSGADDNGSVLCESAASPLALLGRRKRFVLLCNIPGADPGGGNTGHIPPPTHTHTLTYTHMHIPSCSSSSLAI